MIEDPKAVDEVYRTGLRHFVARFAPHDADAFRSVVERNPKHPDAHYQLAKVAGYEKRWGDALQAMSSHLRILPEDREALLQAALLAHRLSKFEDAIEYTNRLLALDEGHYLARRTRSAARIRLNGFADALTDLDVLIQRESFDPQLFELRAKCHDGLGHPEAARIDRDRLKQLCTAGRIPISGFSNR